MHNRRPSRFYSYYYFNFHPLDKLDLPPEIIDQFQENSVATLAELERTLPDHDFLGKHGPDVLQEILDKVNAYRLGQLHGTPIDVLKLTRRMEKILAWHEISTVEELHANLYRLSNFNKIRGSDLKIILDRLDIWQSTVTIPNHRNHDGLVLLREKPKSETPLRALRFCIRTENALLRAGISSVESLQENVHRLNYFRAIGPRTIDEIESRLAEWNQYPVGQNPKLQTNQSLVNLLQGTLLDDLGLLKSFFRTDATIYDLMVHILKYPGLYMCSHHTKRRRKMEIWLREEQEIDVRRAYWIVEARLWMRRKQTPPSLIAPITKSIPQSTLVADLPPTPAQNFQQVFEKLPQRIQFVLERMYGLCEQKETLKIVSITMGITRERVRQIKNNGLKQLAHTIPYYEFAFSAQILEHIHQQNGLISSKQLAGRLQESFASSGYRADAALAGCPGTRCNFP